MVETGSGRWRDRERKHRHKAGHYCREWYRWPGISWGEWTDLVYILDVKLIDLIVILDMRGWETRKSQACFLWSCLRMVTLTEMREIIRLWRKQSIYFEVYLCGPWGMVVEIKEISLRHIITEVPLRYLRENVKLTVIYTHLQLRGNI